LLGAFDGVGVHVGLKGLGNAERSEAKAITTASGSRM